MIQSITITEPKGNKLELKLTNPSASGLIVESITGLGPPKATINTTELATIDGSMYASSRCQTRNIVIKLRMWGAPTIEAARQKTYAFFPIKKQIRLDIKTDNREAYIIGYVESNEPDIFSSEESVQISILCPDPYFYEVGGQTKVYSNVLPLFEFPFSNESLDARLLEFSEIIDDPRAYIVYDGDVDTGMILDIQVTDPCGDVTIYNVETNESIKIFDSKIQSITGSALKNKDDVVISTIKGDRSAYLIRDGVRRNIIAAISRDSDWFQLEHGSNYFTYTTGVEDADISIGITYRNAYGGI